MMIEVERAGCYCLALCETFSRALLGFCALSKEVTSFFRGMMKASRMRISAKIVALSIVRVTFSLYSLMIAPKGSSARMIIPDD